MAGDHHPTQGVWEKDPLVLVYNCDGVTYSTGSQQYNQVCGRIIGYQVGDTEAFRRVLVDRLMPSMLMELV